MHSKSHLEYSNILVRATNWVGDAVMSLPALRAIRERFPNARISVLAKPWVADLYGRESFLDEIILYSGQSPWRTGRELRAKRFDCAILLQNAFEAAWIAWLAGIPNRIGYKRDGRQLLLTRAVDVPKPGEIPRHERFYYLELLRRAGLPGAALKDAWPASEEIRLGSRAVKSGLLSNANRVIGVSPGAAYGTAKRWLPERFAQAACALATARGASIALFGSKTERELCDEVARRLNGCQFVNYAGQTTLAQFIDLASGCELFLTNDSGAMHIASALGVPTVAIFGATDDTTTGPTGPNSRVVRQAVECSPCLLRECPIDHRCMTGVSAERVVKEAIELLHSRLQVE
jgi:heptosyltransferase-2